ncbi:Exo_endo_phos domain-containing protein, partial [Cephalotus follicularis]
WRLTGIYGRPEAHLRHETWSLLRVLSSQINIPWLCVGDFNEILLVAEKEGGNKRSGRQMDAFRHALDFCRLRDMGFQGCPFTCRNGGSGEERVSSRLDRCVSTTEWLSLFPRATVTHEVCGISDHCPMLLSLHGSKKIKTRQEEINQV